MPHTEENSPAARWTQLHATPTGSPPHEMACQLRESPQLITVLPEEDHAYLVDTIQEATRVYSDAQRLLIAFEWEWMANELRRVVALEVGVLRPSPD
jgi:hypothetical protein